MSHPFLCYRIPRSINFALKLASSWIFLSGGAQETSNLVLWSWVLFHVFLPLYILASSSPISLENDWWAVWAERRLTTWSWLLLAVLKASRKWPRWCTQLVKMHDNPLRANSLTIRNRNFKRRKVRFILVGDPWWNLRLSGTTSVCFRIT